MGEDLLKTGEDLLASLSMDIPHHPSTVLSMDSSSIFHVDLSKEMNTSVMLTRPPDINLPLSVEPSPSPQSWSRETFDLDVGLGNQSSNIDSDGFINNLPKKARKCAKGLDSVWGAWFFFSYYFKPVFVDKSKSKYVRDGIGFSEFDKANLNLEVFLVQHDMENMYMWVFKDRPENALGLMKLRSYMNGHSRQHPFPFCIDKGFIRSHRMQRKHYRGLSNPQCVHGIELVPSPNLKELDQEEQKRWMELTGRDLNFSIAAEASEYSSWRNLPNIEFELEHPLPLLKTNLNSHSKKVLNGSGLNLSTQISNLTTLSAQLSGITNGGGIDISHVCNKRKKDSFLHVNDEDCCLLTNQHNDRVQDREMHPIEAPWIKDFSGVMKDVYGPVTAAKTIYEDEQGYLIIVSLPFADLKRVKVTWWNNLTHGVVKISSVSTTCMPLIKRNDRTFKLTDPSPEHCPPGEFVREVPLPTRIPDDAKLEAYEDETGTGLEIMVPKHRVGPEEHEVVVCLRPHLGSNEL